MSLSVEEIALNLGNLVGSEKVVTKSSKDFDSGSFLAYGTDRTKVFEPNYDILVFPENTLEVSKILKYCFDNSISVVPSGGRTGYAGGAVAANKELVLSLAKMNSEVEFDPFLGALTVQAGMITKDLHKLAESYGYQFPVDFSATGSSHIGGNIATNAGGVRVVRYGLIRNWILGLTVVTGTGEVLKFNGGILKNNTGYDLKHLFLGSEGTLGVITETTVKLTSIPKDYRVLLVSIDSFSKILELFKLTHSYTIPILAYEFFTQYCLEKVKHHLGVNSPFPHESPYYVLLEFEISRETDEELLNQFLEEITEKELITNGSLAQNSHQNETFWKYREGISESLSMAHTVHKNDISLPLRHMEKFVSEMENVLREKYPGFEIALFGHVGDGNLHLNIVKPEGISKDLFFRKCKEVDPIMFQLIQKFGGSISAEHGIGLLKKEFLSFSRSPEEIAIMKGIKKVLDPKGILNPGKLF